MVADWNAIKNDPKLDVFIAKLNNLFFDKNTNLEGKLVIFSESKDTVDYLAQALKDKFRKDVLVVSSENREQLYDTIVN